MRKVLAYLLPLEELLEVIELGQVLPHLEGDVLHRYPAPAAPEHGGRCFVDLNETSTACAIVSARCLTSSTDVMARHRTRLRM